MYTQQREISNFDDFISCYMMFINVEQIIKSVMHLCAMTFKRISFRMTLISYRTQVCPVLISWQFSDKTKDRQVSRTVLSQHDREHHYHRHTSAN